MGTCLEEVRQAEIVRDQLRVGDCNESSLTDVVLMAMANHPFPKEGVITRVQVMVVKPLGRKTQEDQQGQPLPSSFSFPVAQSVSCNTSRSSAVA